MEIEKLVNGINMTIRVKGRLDTNTASQFENELENLDSVENLELDFRDLEYISSAGLRIILTLQKLMSTRGRLVIKNVNDSVKNVFDITGFTDILTIE